MKLSALFISLMFSALPGASAAWAQTSAEEFYQRGLIRQERGDVDDAISDLSRAIEINPRLDLAQRQNVADCDTLQSATEEQRIYGPSNDACFIYSRA